MVLILINLHLVEVLTDPHLEEVLIDLHLEEVLTDPQLEEVLIDLHLEEVLMDLHLEEVLMDLHREAILMDLHREVASDLHQEEDRRQEVILTDLEATILEAMAATNQTTSKVHCLVLPVRQNPGHRSPQDLHNPVGLAVVVAVAAVVAVVEEYKDLQGGRHLDLRKDLARGDNGQDQVDKGLEDPMTVPTNLIRVTRVTMGPTYHQETQIRMMEVTDLDQMTLV